MDLFEWRGRTGSAVSLALPSIGWWRVLSWRVCEMERGRPENRKDETAKYCQKVSFGTESRTYKFLVQTTYVDFC